MRSQQGEEPTRWFRMERTTGQYETMPIPDTDHLCGVWNNQLVLFRERCAEPFTSDKMSDYSLAGSYSSRSRTPVMTLCCTTPSPPKAGGYTA